MTIPINIKGITNTLEKVSEKMESVIIVCEMLNEIEEQKKILNKEQMGLTVKARELINTICESIQLDAPKPKEKIDVGSLSINLIERDSLWKKPNELGEIHSALFHLIQDIHDKMYPEEEEEFKDLEEYFDSSLPEMEIKVKCECGSKFATWLNYGGVVAREERQMSPELLHVWNSELDCPKCGKFVEIELRVWEYPTGCLNNVEFESNCEILNEKEIYDKIGIIPS